MKYFCRLLFIAFFFTSCGTMRFNKTSDFSAIKDVRDLNGSYSNRLGNYSILSCFNIREYADFVTFASENPNEIKLIYNNDSTKQERTFSGQMKKNYFEIYFSKQQFFIPLIYSSCSIDRIRVGKSKNGNLLIREFIDQSGNLLFLAGGYSRETPCNFSPLKEHNDYMPIEVNGLWGYSDSMGDTVISAKYDFASIFECGVARVKLSNKWGLINRRGEAITPFKYDWISLVDEINSPPIFKVSIGGKYGIMDANGNETIPVIYDYIGHFAHKNPSNLNLIRLGYKVGYANRTHVVVPAIYSDNVSYYGNRALVKRDGKYYMVDNEGYEYETKGVWTMRDPIPKSKRKIQFEEQEIE